MVRIRQKFNQAKGLLEEGIGTHRPRIVKPFPPLPVWEIRAKQINETGLSLISAKRISKEV